MKRYMKKNDILKLESKSFLACNKPQFGLMLNHVHPYSRLSVRWRGVVASAPRWAFGGYRYITWHSM